MNENCYSFKDLFVFLKSMDYLYSERGLLSYASEQINVDVWSLRRQKPLMLSGKFFSEDFFAGLKDLGG